MHGRELLSKMFRTYLILVTLINLVIFVSGTITRPEERFGYEVFVYPLIYALVGVIPQLVMYSKHELAIKEVVLRKFIQLLVIEFMVNGVIFGRSMFVKENLVLVKTVSICIIVVFIMANIISWVMDSVWARRITKELEEFQKING